VLFIILSPALLIEVDTDPDDPHNHITLETLLDQVNEHERKFFVKLDAEVKKIEAFYACESNVLTSLEFSRTCTIDVFELLAKELETEKNIGILKRQLQEMKDVRRLKRRKVCRCFLPLQRSYTVCI